MEFKNFIFDVDGTIIDTEKISTNSLDKALQEVCNIKLSQGDLEKHFGIPSLNFFKMYNLTPVEEIIEKWNKYYYEEKQTLFADIHLVIKALHEDGYSLSIVTSRVRNELKDLDDLGVGSYFTMMVSADDTIKHKPCGDPIEKVINDLNLNKEETVYIGDTTYDSQSARNAGIKFALAGWGARDKNIDCDIYLEKPKDILEYKKK